ncbi:MAG TPA: lactonase family protein [Verrucomicrobiae bacterium]|nr:lactonase family protein [Verrucomicrobiae bacterium]
MRTSFQATMRLSRRLVLLFLALAVALSVHAAGAAKYLVYVGTYTNHGSKGIYAYRFDTESGALDSLGLAVETPQPSFLAASPSGRFLYSVNELDQFDGKPSGGVSAFSIDSATGRLTLLNQVSSLGPGPAYITLDRTGRFVFVANYTEGSVAVFRLSPDGNVGASTAYVRHDGSSVNPERQEGPHAHCVLLSPDNRFALVADLGLDQVFVYPFDASRGTLGQPRIVKVAPGSGPRHLAFGANGKFVYLISEMRSTITVYSYNSSDGAMHRVQTISSLPPGFKGSSTAAEIVVHPSGKFLYASNRGDDCIAGFAVDSTKGTLAPIEYVPTGGKTPRNFAVDPSGEWLLAANQDSNNVVTFRINRKTGRLTQAGAPIEVFSPAMVDFVQPAKEK